MSDPVRGSRRKAMVEQVDSSAFNKSFDVLYEHELYKYIDMDSPVEIFTQAVTANNSSVEQKKEFAINEQNKESYAKFFKFLVDLYQGLSVRGFTISEIFEYTERFFNNIFKKNDNARNPDDFEKYLSVLAKFYSKDFNKVVGKYVRDSIKVIANDQLVNKYPMSCYVFLHNKFHDTLGNFMLSIPEPIKKEKKKSTKKKKSERKVEEKSEFYRIENIISTKDDSDSSIINKNILSPTKLNPAVSSILINNPYMRLGTKNFLESAVFLNCANTMEMSKSYPFFRAQMIVPTFVKERMKKTFTAGTINQFLFGDLEEEQTTELYKIFQKEFIKEGPDGEPYRKGSTVDMSVFTMPQTIVNLDEEFVGHSSTGKKPKNRLNFVQDPTQPFMSIEKFDVAIQPSAGLMSYKTATMSITVHDKSRLQDVAPLIKPDLFGAFGAEILVEYGYKHMDAINKSKDDILNPIGEFINSSVVAEKYLITSSNINMGKSGKITVDIKLALKGPTDFKNIRIFPNGIDAETKNSLTNAARFFNKYAKRPIIVNGYINIEPDNIRKTISNITKDINTLRKSVSTVKKRGAILPVDKSSRIKFNSAAYALIKVLTSRKSELEKWSEKNDVYRNSVLGNCMNTYDPYWDLDLESNLTRLYEGKKIDSFKRKRNVILQNPVITPDKFVTLGNLMTAIVGQHLGTSQKYDEIQMIFYTANENSGEMSCRNLSSILIDKATVKKFLDSVNSKNQVMTVEGMLSSIIKDQVVNNKHISFGMADIFLEQDSEKSKKSDSEKKENVEEKVKERLKKIYNIDEATAESDTDSTKFVMPIVNLTFDCLTDPENDPDKTILRISVFDKNDNPYTSLYNIYRDTIEGNFYDKVRQIANLDKQLSDSTDPNNRRRFKQKIKKIYDDLKASGVVKETQENGVKIAKINPDKNVSDFKQMFKKALPVLTYGSENSPVINANVTTMEDNLLATTYIVNAAKNSEALQNRFDIDLPLKILPTQVSVDTVGFPWASFGQMYFVDFETNTTMDNVYVVTGLSHSLSQGKFNTSIKLGLQESFGTFETSAELLSRALQKSDAPDMLNSHTYTSDERVEKLSADSKERPIVKTENKSGVNIITITKNSIKNEKYDLAYSINTYLEKDNNSFSIDYFTTSEKPGIKIKFFSKLKSPDLFAIDKSELYFKEVANNDDDNASGELFFIRLKEDNNLSFIFNANDKTNIITNITPDIKEIIMYEPIKIYKQPDELNSTYKLLHNIKDVKVYFEYKSCNDEGVKIYLNKITWQKNDELKPVDLKGIEKLRTFIYDQIVALKYVIPFDVEEATLEKIENLADEFCNILNTSVKLDKKENELNNDDIIKQINNKIFESLVFKSTALKKYDEDNAATAAAAVEAAKPKTIYTTNKKTGLKEAQTVTSYNGLLSSRDDEFAARKSLQTARDKRKETSISTLKQRGVNIFYGGGSGGGRTRKSFEEVIEESLTLNVSSHGTLACGALRLAYLSGILPFKDFLSNPGRFKSELSSKISELNSLYNSESDKNTIYVELRNKSYSFLYDYGARSTAEIKPFMFPLNAKSFTQVTASQTNEIISSKSTIEVSIKTREDTTNKKYFAKILPDNYEFSISNVEYNSISGKNKIDDIINAVREPEKLETVKKYFEFVSGLKSSSKQLQQKKYLDKANRTTTNEHMCNFVFFCFPFMQYKTCLQLLKLLDNKDFTKGTNDFIKAGIKSKARQRLKQNNGYLFIGVTGNEGSRKRVAGVYDKLYGHITFLEEDLGITGQLPFIKKDGFQKIKSNIGLVRVDDIEDVEYYEIKNATGNDFSTYYEKIRTTSITNLNFDFRSLTSTTSFFDIQDAIRKKYDDFITINNIDKSRFERAETNYESLILLYKQLFEGSNVDAKIKVKENFIKSKYKKKDEKKAGKSIADAGKPTQPAPVATATATATATTDTQ